MSCFGIENVGPVSGIETSMSCFGIDIVCLVSGIEIVASAPITIQAVMQNLRSTDSFLVLPTEALGIDYFVMSYGERKTGAIELVRVANKSHFWLMHQFYIYSN